MKEEIKIFLTIIFTGLLFIFFTLDEYKDVYSQYIPYVVRVEGSKYYSPIKISKNYIKSGLASIFKGSDDVSITVVADNVNKSNNVNQDSIITDNETYDEISRLQLPIKVQLIGDSMMLEGFGPRMEYKLELYQGITVYRYGKYSTGLNRVDYFDWYSETSKTLGKNKPDVLIVIFGGNEGQTIKDLDSGLSYKFGHDLWDDVYRKRVSKYLQETSSKVREIYWVGQTIPRTNDFYKKFILMNQIYKEECDKYINCNYVDEWSRFSIDGKYSPTLANDQGVVKVVKGSDGVHVTSHGGDIMADEVIKMMIQDIDF